MEIPKAVRDFLTAPVTPVDGSQDLSSYREELDRIKQEIDKLTEIHRNLEQSLVTKCDHRFKAVTSRYISGDYLNTSETIYTVSCVTCCATLFEHSQSGGAYG